MFREFPWIWNWQVTNFEYSLIACYNSELRRLILRLNPARSGWALDLLFYLLDRSNLMSMQNSLENSADLHRQSGDLELAQELAGPQDSGPEDASRRKKTSSRRKMMCFSCNRPDRHYLATKKRRIYSFLLGISLGLILIVGPYRCQCCGTPRLMSHDSLNLRYWYRILRNPVSGKNKKRSRRSK